MLHPDEFPPSRRRRRPERPDGVGFALAIFVTLVVVVGGFFAAHAYLRRQQAEADRLAALERKPAFAPQMGLSMTILAPKDSPYYHEPAGSAYNKTGGTLLIEPETLDPSSPEVMAARAVLDAFLAEPDWTRRDDFVLRPRQIESRMRDFYVTQGGADPSPGAMVRAMRFRIGTSTVVELTFVCEKRVDGHATASFHQTNGRAMKLDWESFTGYSPLTWAQMRARKLPGPIMVRAYASLDDYHNFEFKDAALLSIKLRNADGSSFINGFFPQDTSVGRMLHQMLAPEPEAPAKVLPMSLIIAFPLAPQSDHCVRILGFVAPRWLLFDGEMPQ